MNISDFNNCSEMMARVRDGSLDPNFHDALGNTPLGFAAKEGETHAINALLKANADPSKINEKELCSLFQLLINKHDARTLEKVLSKLDNDRLASVNNISGVGQTPLIYAAIGLMPADIDSLVTFNFILQRSENVNYDDDHGMTPLTTILMASQTEEDFYFEAAKNLIDKGADPDFINRTQQKIEDVVGPNRLINALRRYKTIKDNEARMQTVVQQEFREPERTEKPRI